jgi:hypothetical protein
MPDSEWAGTGTSGTRGCWWQPAAPGPAHLPVAESARWAALAPRKPEGPASLRSRSGPGAAESRAGGPWARALGPWPQACWATAGCGRPGRRVASGGPPFKLASPTPRLRGKRSRRRRPTPPRELDSELEKGSTVTPQEKSSNPCGKKLAAELPSRRPVASFAHDNLQPAASWIVMPKLERTRIH